MKLSYDAFIDELEKIAVQLNKKEQLKQDLQFAALGTVAAPAVTGLSNLIGSGRIVPPHMKPGRWLAASAASGLVGGSLLPIIRRKIEQRNKSLARQRLAEGV